MSSSHGTSADPTSICFVTAVSTIYKGLELPLPFLSSLPEPSHRSQTPSSSLILDVSSATGVAAIQLLRTPYPTMPILVTASPKHHARLTRLGATHCVDYRSPSVLADIKNASPDTTGVDAIIDCVAAGKSQPDITDIFRANSRKRYAAVVSGPPWRLAEDVDKVDVGAWDMLYAEGGKQLMLSLPKLVEEGSYKVPLPVRVVGRGPEKFANVLDEVKKVNAEKVVVSL